MRRVGIIAALSMVFVALGATAAKAGPHYVAPAGDPVCTVNEATDTVSCTGTEIAGVGNNNAEATLVVNASATLLCHNPGNDNIVEPHTVNVTKTASTGQIEPKNGRLIVPAVSTTATLTPTPTCPNPNWRAEITDVTITSFTYTLTLGGEVFFTTSGP